MAGFKVTYKSKIEGSTIMEVVIAMALIMVVFSIAMMIITNVIQSSITVKKIKAQAILNAIMINDEKNTIVMTQTFIVDGCHVDQVIKNYREEVNLIEVDLKVYDEANNQVAELKRIIIKNNE